MSKQILIKTNILVCIILIVGFTITSVISYYSNNGQYLKDVENVSTLTSEGIYYQMSGIFAKPVHVSLTMANDNLLRESLLEEQETIQEDYVDTIKNYLMGYKKKYSYDSVFLVSTKMNRYYNFNGVNRILNFGNPENDWYYDMLESEEDYSLNVDNDEASNNEITVFVNCKIRDSQNNIMGIVGVGLRVQNLQMLLKDYEEKLQLKAYFIDQQGVIQISTRETGYREVRLFDSPVYEGFKYRILGNKDSKNADSYWYSGENGKTYMVVRYIPELSWYLIVESDTGELVRKLHWQLVRRVLVMSLIIIGVVFVITTVINRLLKEIVRLTMEREHEQQAVFKTATEHFYDNIYELNITDNCAADRKTEEYFESLGISGKTPFDVALRVIAEKQIKEEFQKGYVCTFSPENVKKAYEEGTESLIYDFMIRTDQTDYYWIRITSYIYFLQSDQTLRMITYQQNIDKEKRMQRQMLEKTRKDAMTGLYNKKTTEDRIREMLSGGGHESYAFFIFDIDNFKQVNDQYGHAAGDEVIKRFASAIASCFQEEDIVGRIGGDEFAAFLPVSGREWVRQKSQELSEKLHMSVVVDRKKISISASIGIALAPLHGVDFPALYKQADIALYETKKKGKNGYTLLP